jgi:hypothetical protein
VSDIINIDPTPCCANCGAETTGEFSIHRDGFCDGPEVDLCNACGSEPTPTVFEIWENIRARRTIAAVEARADEHPDGLGGVLREDAGR